MGKLLEAIEQSTEKEIEAGGMLWRVKKIASSDLARVGHAALALSQALSGDKKTKPKKGKAAKKDESDGMEDFVASMAKQPVDRLATMARLKDSVVAAGLIAVGSPQDGHWESVQAVLDRDKADAKEGRLWVGSIPSEISDRLFEAVMDVSTESGEVLARIASFRGEPGDPSGDRPGGEALRKVAP
jgi:hypothetical protein